VTRGQPRPGGPRGGRTTTDDTSVGKGTTVTGQVSAPNATALSWVRLELVNAETGENMGVTDWSPVTGPTYTAQVKGRSTSRSTTRPWCTESPTRAGSAVAGSPTPTSSPSRGTRSTPST